MKNRTIIFVLILSFLMLGASYHMMRRETYDTNNNGVVDSVQGTTSGSIPFINSSLVLAEDNSNLFYDAANKRVGIGTDIPRNKLHIEGAGDENVYVEFSSSLIPRKNIIGVENYDDLVLGADETNEGGGSRIRFRVDGSQKMVIDSDGNVGIGTNSPGYILDVQSPSLNTLARFYSGDNGALIRFEDTTNSWQCGQDTGHDFVITDATEGTVPFQILNKAPTNSLYINGLGNVGIGTASPRNRVDVSGGQVIGAGYAGVETAPTNGLLVEGNVGIGTASPTAVLHLKAGTATAGTAPLKLTSGTLLTTKELGAVEFTDDGEDGKLYITLNIGGTLTRKEISLVP